MAAPQSENLFASELWQPALEKFGKSTQLTVQVFDLDGQAVSGPLNPTPLFELFRSHDFDPRIVDQCARQCVMQTPRRARPAVIISEYHGLAVVGTSLMLSEKIVGAAVAGYALSDFSQVSEVKVLARKAGIEFEKVWEINRQQQPIPRSRLLRYGELLQVLGDALLAENLRTRIHAATEDTLAKELNDTRKLQDISGRMIQGGDVQPLLEQILDAAVEMMDADFGSVQLYHPDSRQLELIASRGFNEEARKFWKWVDLDSGSTCAAALRNREPVIAENVETCEFIVGTKDLDIYRGTEIRAVQSTPLVSRAGNLLGMISTHWRVPHRPQARDLRHFDILARQAADLLERELAEVEREKLLASEQRARRDAEEANRAKDDFLAVVSHELLNPLSVITLWAQIIKSERDPERLSHAGDVIDRNAQQQRRVLEDLLDLNRMKRGTISMDVSVQDLSAILSSLVESFQMVAKEKKILLEASLEDAPVYVNGDAVRLRQIFTNIIANAFKYTTSGTIRVNAEVDGAHVAVSVRDTGRGITPEFLPKAFEMFRQQDTGNTRSYSGLGIGLALVKELVQRHRGAIEITSPGADLGTEVIVHLPLWSADSRAEAGKIPSASAGRASELGGLVVLVVEDSDDARDAAELMLQSLGASVSTARDGLEALEVMQSADPDVILCDLAMPRMDGFQFVQELRSRDGAMHCPVIAVSAFTSPSDHARTRAAGFAAHVDKPFTLESLLSALANVQRAA